MGKTLNLSGEELCALEHILNYALTAEKYVRASTTGGTGGAWKPVHSGIHKVAAQNIKEKLGLIW